MLPILGVNHQFLYPESITDAAAHTATLKALAASGTVQALDCWLWRGARAVEERQILLDSGKIIHYNIGDRAGEAVSFPASPDARVRSKSRDLVRREIGYALSLGAKKIVLGSGPDVPGDHAAAIERFAEFLAALLEDLPHGVTLALEPADWDMDKRFLVGPLAEAAALVRRLRQDGHASVGLLLDMGHVPLLHESLSTALEKTAGTLVHIHLGNCICHSRAHPLFGDRHVPWDVPEGEFSTADGMRFLSMLRETGYFEAGAASVSFEMRPIPGFSPAESLSQWTAAFLSALQPL